MADDAVLSDYPTLTELQHYVAMKSLQRGFNHEIAQGRFMLLLQGVGELVKTIRPFHGIKMVADARDQVIKHELADVFSLLLSLSNKLDIDIEQAVFAKEAKKNNVCGNENH
ncbi:MAG: MazG nucleotide pyrophosphohydrolase domain-containing protein [Candidatus Saccharimonadales bacterium]